MPYVVSVGFRYIPNRRDVQWYAGVVEWPGQREPVPCDHHHATAAEAKRCAAEQREAMVASGVVSVREEYGRRTYVRG